MRYSPDEDKRVFAVVMNPQGQYSIWPLNIKLPLGWSNVGKTGPRDACLDHIGKAMSAVGSAETDSEHGKR